MTQREINILSVEPDGDYRLTLNFDDGTTRTVDFLPFLSRSHHPDIRAFLDRGRFASFRLEYGELVWGDFDLCFPVMDLYYDRIWLKTHEEAAA
jgi:hypothetical protein